VASEAHLMVCEPVRHVGDWTDLCDTIVVCSAPDHAAWLRIATSP
jgi:transposase